MTIAMLFLIEATAACDPATPARLGGGAVVAPAVLDFEEQAPEPSVVTTVGLSNSTSAAPGDAGLETTDPGSDPAEALCNTVATVIA